MKTLTVKDIRSYYHDYLLSIHKNWNRPGTHTDTAEQYVIDTMYLWNHDHKSDFWRYLSGEYDIEEAYSLIRSYLKERNANEDRQNYYCNLLAEFKQYIEVELGGIDSVVDDEHIVVTEVVDAADVKKLNSIKVTDSISFDYNYQVLNKCFGANMRGSLQQALWNPGDGCLVWFPQLAKYENGKYIAGSKQVNWKNYFEAQGNIIVQMLYPGEPVSEEIKEPTVDDNVVPFHTFMKMGERDFRYVGTYLRDLNCSTARFVIFRRIKESIDLSIWAGGRDMDYFDTAEIGKDVFKDFYIEKNFKKQQAYIKTFLEYDANNKQREDIFNDVINRFVEKYKMQTLSTMTEKLYQENFLPDLCVLLNTIFDCNYKEEYLLSTFGNLQMFGRNLLDLLYDEENSIDSKMRNAAFGTKLAAQIYTVYNLERVALIYTLDETTVDKMLFSLGIKTNDEDDLVSKQSKLYFWRYCDHTVSEWPIFKFYLFLHYISKQRRGNIKYISAAKPDIRKRIITETKNQDEEILVDTLDDAPSEFEYCSKPRPCEINTDVKSIKAGSIVPRHADRKQNALVRAGFCCEIDKNHPTFIRRNSKVNYTETHHLIPLEYSAEFEYTLDTEENIVSLCSNCHNQIHYGAGAEVLIKKLYDERIDALRAAGIGKTKSGIEVTYEQLLHMYGLSD